MSKICCLEAMQMTSNHSSIQFYQIFKKARKLLRFLSVSGRHRIISIWIGSSEDRDLSCSSTTSRLITNLNALHWRVYSSTNTYCIYIMTY